LQIALWRSSLSIICVSHFPPCTVLIAPLGIAPFGPLEVTIALCGSSFPSILRNRRRCRAGSGTRPASRYRLSSTKYAPTGHKSSRLRCMGSRPMSVWTRASRSELSIQIRQSLRDAAQIRSFIDNFRFHPFHATVCSFSHPSDPTIPVKRTTGWPLEVVQLPKLQGQRGPVLLHLLSESGDRRVLSQKKENVIGKDSVCPRREKEVRLICRSKDSAS
jgi:hypothetical protein